INTMLMSVMERMKEFGVLRSMGWTSDDVMKLIVAESALIGLGGGVIGSVLGLTVVEIAKSVIDIPMRVTPELWAAAMAFSLVSGLLGGIYPAWKAGKIDPLEAIRTE
ncbi:MAG: FtsX-like permease family protein, partial [Candidatus Diapherotrites archaeon]|nr:FtsX-like permease family protein [Candidatus Diapherotrites archaeon]